MRQIAAGRQDAGFIKGVFKPRGLSSMGAKENITPGVFPQSLEWNQTDSYKSLDHLYEFVNEECKKAIDWYFGKKERKRIAGYAFRVGSIMALGFSGIIPILVEIYKVGDEPGISPAWATVALAIAAILVSLDRFGGYTSGWINYIRTAQVLTQLQSIFRVEWEHLQLELQAERADRAIIEKGIEKCREFLEQVHSTVRTETDQWSQDFQKVLLEFDDKMKK
jgi:hypothetical protein